MKKSFSLIEVLIFVTIMSLFFIVAIAAVTVSIRQMVASQHKILATHYAQELMQWLKDEKESGGWQDFTTIYNGRLCFNNKDDLKNSTSPCPDPIVGYLNIEPAIFQRYAIISGSGNARNVSVIVTWQEVSNKQSVNLNSTFTVWE